MKEKTKDILLNNKNPFLAVVSTKETKESLYVLKKLCKIRAKNINDLDENGYNALMLASVNRNKDSVKILIKNGASCLVQNNYGNTALSIVANRKKKKKRDYKIIEILDSAARVEMIQLSIATKSNLDEQNWRCDYLPNKRTSITTEYPDDYRASCPSELRTDNLVEDVARKLLNERRFK